MARKRYLKPGFFKNEDLADLSFADRILFQGLWCWSDREGRLEDRPKRLKSEIFPYDDYNLDEGLSRLECKGFITRYKTLINGNQFSAIQIINFKKHQDVHHREQESIIPAISLNERSQTIPNTVQAPAKVGIATEQATEQEGTSPGHGTTFSVTSPPCNLELDTCNLNLELVIDDDVYKAQARKKEIDEAIENYFNPEPAYLPEKEKSSAKKEKEFPACEEAEAKVSETAHWRNTLEHYKLTPDERQALFKRFYEFKEDNYRVRYPGPKEMAENFYFWVKINHNGSVIQQLNERIKDTKSKTSGKTRQSTSDKHAELRELNAQSRDFLHKSSTFIHQG